MKSLYLRFTHKCKRRQALLLQGCLQKPFVHSRLCGLFCHKHTSLTSSTLNPPARGGPAPRCSVAGKGVGAVDGPQGAAAWETGWVTGEEASGRGWGDGSLGALQARTPVLALGEAAGRRVGNPEEEPDGGSFHPDGRVKGRGESAGDGGDDGEHWGGDGGGDCCCCCSGGGCCCCCCGGGGGSDGLSDRADASLEG